MKANSFCVAWLLTMVLLMGASSCTSKSENASATVAATEQSAAISSHPLEELKKGNARFCKGESVHQHQDMNTVRLLTEGQHPQVVVISCSDSRVPPEIIFDQGLGDLFTIRTAGHVMSDLEEGSVEYAVEHLHSPLVVVLGHEGCGAIGAMLEHAHDEHVEGHIASIVQTLKNEPEEQEVLLEGGEDMAHKAIMANIIHGVKQLRTSQPILAPLYEEGKIQIIGAIYHLDNGTVDFLEI